VPLLSIDNPVKRLNGGPSVGVCISFFRKRRRLHHSICVLRFPKWGVVS
jgi:hypothetical protein